MALRSHSVRARATDSVRPEEVIDYSMEVEPSSDIA